MMGDRVGRVAIFGIPLQQTWSYENSGDYAPTYYLQTDAPLYYYSFTDAVIANAYLSLKRAERDRPRVALAEAPARGAEIRRRALAASRRAPARPRTVRVGR